MKNTFDSNMKKNSHDNEILYQYVTGEFLPDSSQPVSASNFKMRGKKYTPHHSTRYINIEIKGKPVSNGLLLKDGFDEKSILPELYQNRNECCGCAACFDKCPANAILMLPDEEGFLYPVVDAEKCVKCFSCIKVCPIKNEQL